MSPSFHEPSGAPEMSSVIDFLETLLANSKGSPKDICESEELRKRLTSVIRRLVPELETPVDTSQRILYDVFELISARIGVDLGIFDILSSNHEPLSTAELARKTGKEPDLNLLARILKYMASVSLIREVGAGLWAASNYGNNLVDDSYSAGVCHVNDNVVPAYAALPAFLRQHNYRPLGSNGDDTDTAFALGQGVAGERITFFDWLHTRPENARSFNVFMSTHRTVTCNWLERTDVMEAVVEAYVKIGARELGEKEEGNKSERVMFVDVGGGVGQQCNVLKKQWPNLMGRIILEDLDEVVAKAELEDGIAKLGVSFFDEQPVKGAAAYYFRSVLRNWPDSSCQEILKNIYNAMDDEHSLLLIDELVVPDRHAHRLGTQLDMTMLAMLNGEARSYSHWKELLMASGFAIENVAYYEEEAGEAVIVAKKATASRSPRY